MALLYDRDELIALVEQLVGLAFDEDRRLTAGRRGDPPAVMVTGGRGMGKTAALEAVAVAYGNRAPRVLLDLKNERYASQKKPYAQDQPGSGSVSTPLLRLLRDLKWDLELHVRHNGRLRFPRLSLALLAIATWQPGEEITLDDARKRLEHARDSVAGITHDGDDWVNQWVDDVLVDLSGSVVPFPANVFLKASVRVFTAKALNASSRRASFKWHEEHDPRAPGDAYEALITVGRYFRLGGDYRAQAEQALVAAFLADLRAEYQGLARLTRVAFPIALLDNIHASPCGERFLRLVLANRARGDADPLVLVATAPGSFLAQLNARDPGAGWLAQHPPGGRVRRADLTNLGASHVLSMLDAADPQRLPPDLAHLIHRLTGGLPLGVAAITRAVARAAPAPSPDDRTPPSASAPVTSAAILDLQVPDEDGAACEPAASYILSRLMPDHRWRSRFITLAPARDRTEAQAIAEAHLTASIDRATVSEAADRLRAGGWVSGPCPEHFVGDPFLRALLLHQLNRKTPSASTKVHATLRDHYEHEGTGLLARSERFRLYHCLALGDTAEVVRRLHDSFAGSSADSWLDAIQDICCAPHGDYPDQRGEVALGDAQTEEGQGKEGQGKPAAGATYRAVSRLLHAAWLLADPLVPPDAEVADKIAEDLKFLATQHPTGNAVLSQAARTWPARLLAWEQADARPS